MVILNLKPYPQGASFIFREGASRIFREGYKMMDGRMADGDSERECAVKG